MIGETCLPLDSDQWASMPTDFDAEFYEYKSSFWSIRRHKWIKGPNLQNEIGRNFYTIMPTEAIFVMENIDENDDVLVELVSKELNHFGVIAGLFQQIGGHCSRFVLFCSF